MSLALFDILTGKFSNQISIKEIDPSQIIYYSISAHLTRLLNTRRGSLVHLPDYGLPDICEIYRNLPYSISLLIHSIKNLIEKYEPRLTEIKIMQKDNHYQEHVLTLEIYGRVKKGEKLQFNTYFINNGAAKIF